jgi:hypothetical protein
LTGSDFGIVHSVRGGRVSDGESSARKFSGDRAAGRGRHAIDPEPPTADVDGGQSKLLVEKGPRRQHLL